MTEHRSESDRSPRSSCRRRRRGRWSLAFGVTLLFAGLLTHMCLVRVLGAAADGGRRVGWFREVLPHERRETRAARAGGRRRSRAVARQVAHLDVGEHAHRARLPIQMYPVSAGIKGGLAGGVAMALLAVLLRPRHATAASGIRSTCSPARSTDESPS